MKGFAANHVRGAENLLDGTSPTERFLGFLLMLPEPFLRLLEGPPLLFAEKIAYNLGCLLALRLANNSLDSLFLAQRYGSQAVGLKLFGVPMS